MSVQIGGDISVGLNGGSSPLPEGAAQGEQVARAAAEAARRVATEKAQIARDAIRVAANANRRADLAENSVRTKEALLQEKGPELDPQSRSELEQQIASAREDAGRLREEATNANADAGEARQDARAAEEKRFEVETTANRVLKAIGKGEPFQANRPVDDTFTADLIPFKMAQLLGNPKLPHPRQAAAQDAKRMLAALKAGLTNGTQVLEQQLEANLDPAYREAFLSDAEANFEWLGHELAGGNLSDLQDEAAQQSLATLARSAELLDPAGAQRMAQFFVRGALDGKSQLEDPELFGLRLKDALSSEQSGATFGLELALAFDGAGDQAAAQQILEALCRAMEEARERFDKASRQIDALDAELSRYLTSPTAWANSSELLDGMLRFEDGHLAQYAEYEQAAVALGAMLPGGARILDRARAGRLPDFSLIPDLLRQVGLMLARTDRLILTNAGAEQMSAALEAQGRGERTFLDVLPDVARGLESQRLRVVGTDDSFDRSGKLFLQSVGEAMAQLLAPQILQLRASARLEEVARLLKTAVGRNAPLFGLDAPEVTRATVIFTTMVHGKRASSVTDALTSLKAFGNVALKSLGLVLAGTSYIASSSGTAPEIATVLQNLAGRMEVGKGGTGIVASMLERPAPTPAMAGLLVLVGTGLLANVGAVTPKVAEAYSALVSGISGQDFSADADFLTDIGSMLSSLCGERLADAIAAAALLARARPPAAKKPTPKPSEDVAVLRAYLQRAA